MTILFGIYIWDRNGLKKINTIPIPKNEKIWGRMPELTWLPLKQNYGIISGKHGAGKTVCRPQPTQPSRGRNQRLE